MKKKEYSFVFTTLFSLVLMFGFMPTTFAAAPSELWVNGVDIITDADHTVECGGGTAIYDPSNNILTLSNAVVTKDGNNRAIYANGDLQIVLDGINSVSDAWACIQVQNGSLSILGTGSLNVTNAAAYGIIADNDLSISADVEKLYVSAATQALRSEQGGSITIGGSIYAENSQKITIEKGQVSNALSELLVSGVDILSAVDYTVPCGPGRAVYDPSSNTLTLENAQINYQQADANDNGAIFFDGNLNINLVGENVIVSNVGGIFSKERGNLTITGDKLTITSVYYGIAKMDTKANVTLDGIELLLNVTNKAPFTGVGVQAGAKLSIINGAYVDAANVQNIAVIGNGGLSISDSTVYAHSLSENGSTAVVSGTDVVISHSVVDVRTNCKKGSVAVAAGDEQNQIPGSVTISNNSKVTIYAATSNAVYTPVGSIVISDSEVTAQTDTLEGYPALIANDDVTISNSVVKASTTGSDSAIWARKNLLIDGTSNVIASGGKGSIGAGGTFTLIPPAGKFVNIWIGDNEEQAELYGGMPISEQTTITENRLYFRSELHAHIFDKKVVSERYKVSDGTCTEPAVYYLSCNCGEHGTDVFEVENAHKFVNIQAKAPACTEPGNIEYWICEVCKKYFSAPVETAETTFESIVIPANGHKYKDGKCTVCGAFDGDFQPMIISGANSAWQKGTTTGLIFVSNAAYVDFIKVQVDGSDLDPAHYELKEGSTVVVLIPAYLETLADGTHTLAIVSKTGTAATTFRVETAPIVNPPSDGAQTGEASLQIPKTGDNANIGVWVALLTVSAFGLGTLLMHKQKSN